MKIKFGCKELLVSIALAFPLAATFKYPTHGLTRLINKEKLELKDNILNDVIKAYYENDISKENNINYSIGYFTRALESGCMSLNNKYIYDKNAELYDYYNDLDYDCIIGKGVCKNESFLISNLLNEVGFNTVPLSCSVSDGNKHAYILIFDEDKKYVYDYTNRCYWKFNSIFEAIPVNKEDCEDITSHPLIFATIGTYVDFNCNDLIKMCSYDNEIDIDKIEKDFKKGLFSFKNEDLIKIKELTYNTKQKIKELEK